MARLINRLASNSLSKVTDVGRHADGGGLYLSISENGGRRWTFLYRWKGKKTEIGFGSARDVTLARARELAVAARAKLAEGVNPKDSTRTAAAAGMTFKQCADKYITAHKGGWRNEKHIAQWESTFNDTNRGKKKFPAFTTVINDLPVSKLGTTGGDAATQGAQMAAATALIMQCLQPIWATKSATAGRVRGRIESVLDWARVNGYRTGENPARWKGHLDHLLPKKSKVKAVVHYPALPYQEIPSFMAELRLRDSVSARALEFTVLTAGRTGAVIGAVWTEIDIPAKTWTVPPERSGTKITGLDPKPRRVPLSDRVVEILNALPREKGNPYVFIGGVAGMPLSNMAMAEMLKGMGYDGDRATVHGMRSSFKDWVSETTHYPNEVSEAALWHIVADKVEAAYRRGELFEKRRNLMDDWDAYCKPIAIQGLKRLPNGGFTITVTG